MAFIYSLHILRERYYFYVFMIGVLTGLCLYMTLRLFGQFLTPTPPPSVNNCFPLAIHLQPHQASTLWSIASLSQNNKSEIEPALPNFFLILARSPEQYEKNAQKIVKIGNHTCGLLKILRYFSMLRVRLIKF